MVWWRGCHGSYHGGKRPSRFSYQHPGRGRYAVAKTKIRPNPVGQDGKSTTCHVCGSIYHRLNDCPDKGYSTSNIEEVNIIFMAQNSDQPVDTNTLVGETLGSMVLDSGTTSAVSGFNWYNCFLDTLPDSIRNNIKVTKGSKVFKFGSRNKLASVKTVMLRCIVAGFRVDINTDRVDADIPLLLSKSAMKKAKVNLNFDSDTIDILGKRIKLMTMSTSHYYVPITKAVSSDGEPIHVFFTYFMNKNSSEKLKILTKLYKQFSHPTGKKLKDLARNAGVTDQEFLTMLEEIPLSCETCLRYKKVQPRPVVGFSLASRFNEWVDLDMKHIKGNKILHLIDRFSKYSVAVRVLNKENSIIINTIFKYWVAYFRCPSNVLTDNGREFDNQYFCDMCQNLNIIVRMTGAESMWSNGVCKRYNGAIEECIIKTLEETKCSFDVAVAWAVSAKNILNTVHGFSPNQLVFGKNPSLLSVALNKPPVLEGVTACDVVAENLNAMHAACKACIASESSEKLRRAQRHQVRPAISARYNDGDLIYFKRNDLD